MQHFHKFITWRLCIAQHVSSAFPPIIRSVQLHKSVVGRGLAGYNLPDHDQQSSNRHSPKANQRLLVQLYAPDDGRKGAQNMLSDT